MERCTGVIHPVKIWHGRCGCFCGRLAVWMCLLLVVLWWEGLVVSLFPSASILVLPSTSTCVPPGMAVLSCCTGAPEPLDLHVPALQLTD